MNDIREIGRKVDALEIIFTAPLWPQRAALSETGAALHDVIVADAKPYALAIVDGDFQAALAVLGRWGAHYDAFADATLIRCDDAAEAEANARLVRVFKHYAGAAGYDFGEIR